MIPKILSQTSPSIDLPRAASRLRESWIRYHPTFQHRFYDDQQSRAVIRDVMPELLSIYDELPFPVMRADLFRYAAVYRDGGYYADIDMECLRPMPDIFTERDCVLAVEAHLTRKRQLELGYPAPIQIANCIFGARPGHPFFLAALRQAQAGLSRCQDISLHCVEDLTGPRMLTRLFFERAWPDMTVAPQVTLMAPMHYPAIWPLSRKMIARHHTFGSWKAEQQKRRLQRIWIERNLSINPFPRGWMQPAEDMLAKWVPQRNTA